MFNQVWRKTGKTHVAFRPFFQLKDLIRKYPVAAVFFAFLGGIGAGVLISCTKRQIAEKGSGKIIPLLIKLVTPFVIRRVFLILF